MTENIDEFLSVYEIAVNYWGGVGTQVAAVQVGVDNNNYVRNIGKSLPTPRASAGDNSPITVARVEIRLVGGELIYDIYRE